MAADHNLDNVVVSLRLKGAEAVRFWHVMDAAKARNPYCDKSHVIRELFGLDKPDLLTPAEVEHFRSGSKRKVPDGIPVAPKSESEGIPMLKSPKATSQPRSRRAK